MTSRRAGPALAAVLTAASLLAAACATPTPSAAAASTPLDPPTATTLPAPPPPPNASPPGEAATPSNNGSTGGGRRGGRAATPSPPADLPPDVSIPPYTIQNTDTATGRWGLLMATRGPATQVLASTAAFYIAAGFTPTSASTLIRGRYTITLAAENRDHTDPTAATITVLITANIG